MQKFLLFVFAITICSVSFSQTVFTYGNKPVSKQEILRSFNKTPLQNNNRKDALHEFLPLFINYKLKVQAGYEEQLDKDNTFQLEFSNFKEQLIDNFINEEANEKKLIQEAFERSKKDIQVQQIFIAFGNDTAAAFKNIQAAHQQLKTGKSFDEVVAKYSSDEESKTNKGDLGFITVFNLPYEIENIIYGLAPQQFSTPYKSKFGYHIFKNIKQRPAAGKRKVAQILLAIPSGSSVSEKNKIAFLADSLYLLIHSGQSFEELAKQFNTDNALASKSGLLPEIGVGEYAVEFEEKVFSMQKINDVTKPFATAYGYHIVKLLEIIPLPKSADDKIKSSVENGDRLSYSKQQLIKKWMIRTNYQKGNYDEKELQFFIDSSINKKPIPVNQKINGATILFYLAKQKLTVDDFIKYAKKQTSNKPTSTLLKEFTENSCKDYYRSHIEEYNSDLKQQVSEFKDASVLFAAMDKHVWSKAAQDSTGLRNYYAANSKKYLWNTSIAGLIITAKNKSLANEVAERIKQRPTEWRIISTSYGLSVVGDSGRYETAHLPIQQKIKLEKGFLSVPEKSSNEESYTFIYVIDVFANQLQRSFEESRGMVMNDYQNVVEEKWINELKKKYPVKVNDEIWKTIK